MVRLVLAAAFAFLSAAFDDIETAMPRGWSPELDPDQPRPGADYWKSGEELMEIDPSQDCAVKKLAYEYGLQLQPELAPLRDVYDALELENCNVKAPERKPFQSPSFITPSDALFVSTKGSDANPGTKASPLKSLSKAVSVARSGSTIVLRAGVHYLTETLTLATADSKLIIQNFEGEEVWLSGGTLLEGLDWKPHNVTQANVWVATVPSSLAQVLAAKSGVLGLNSAAPLQRMTRARWPNRDPLAGTIEKGWSGGGANKNVTWIKDMPWPPPAKTVTNLYPNAKSSHAKGDGGGDGPGSGICGSYWTYGIGGKACDRYTPKGGYLCSNVSSGGGFGWENMVPGSPMFPVGMSFPEQMLRSKGVPAMEPASFKGTIVQVGKKRWTNGWCTTMWEVDETAITEAPSEVSSERMVTLKFGKGGQQTGRGFHPSGGTNKSNPIEGANWRIENALELLDQEEEWYYDSKTSRLYLWHNGTGSPASAGTQWVVPSLKTLVSITGTQKAPVTDVVLRGLGIRDAAYTYMDEWGVPSGGDWALHRGGAIFIEGAENVTTHQCRFDSLDGNAVFLSGYTRRCTVSNSSFRMIGDNAIAAWGYTRPMAVSNSSSADKVLLDLGDAYKGVGMDGTAGDQPRDNFIVGNVIHEIGFNERQSSAFGQFKSCGNVVSGNLMFNMPRAAINANDGFGGGTIVERNLIFNTCRESGDHGPFNSWDRQPFSTDVPPGASVEAPTLLPDYIEIRLNLIISNYGAGFAVDNDDTSSYYRIHNNVFYMGGGVKCDYDGHEKYFFENLMVAMGGAGCWHTCAYKKGYTDHCYNNTMVQAKPPKGRPVAPYAIIWFCNKSNPTHILPDYGNEMLPVIHSNTIYNSDGKATVTCGYSGNAAETTVPLELFTEHGLMAGTKVLPLPSNAETIQWGKELLGIK